MAIRRVRFPRSLPKTIAQPVPAKSRSAPQQAFNKVTISNEPTYSALCIGAGPAGIAAVGNIVELQPTAPVRWIDFRPFGGRLYNKYQGVPSNTKVGLFLQYAKALGTFRDIIDSAPPDNAVKVLEELNQEDQCQLKYAADVCSMLANGLNDHHLVEIGQGEVKRANWDSYSGTWLVQTRQTHTRSFTSHTAARLILTTGSVPVAFPLPFPGACDYLSVDTALIESSLKHNLSHTESPVIGVIGGSHTAVLILRNLLMLSRNGKPDLRVIWFTRSPLRYAEYKDGWIKRDNTGLKGVAASFAKEHLEDNGLRNSESGKIIRKVDTSQRELEQYRNLLPQCTHICGAVGYTPNNLPELRIDGKEIDGPFYDHKNGGFHDRNGKIIPRLYGAGIAFPERVTDPEGNVEMNVGMFKFMKYLKRVVPEWMAE